MQSRLRSGAFIVALGAAVVLFASCRSRETTAPVQRPQDIVIHEPEIPPGSFTPGDLSPEAVEAELAGRRERKARGVLPPPRLEDFSDEDERKIGEATARSILARWPLVPVDKDVSQYVRMVGGILAEGSSRPDLRFHFAIVEADVPNAFAAPYGFVFVTTALLDLIENEAELAFVLAHEIGHVEKRHGLLQIIEGWHESEKRDMSNTALEMAAREGTVLSEEEKALLARSHELSDRVLQAKGRPQETEADLRGIELMARAGYSPQGALTFIQRLATHSGARSSQPDIFLTHPHLEDRYNFTRSALRGIGTDGQILAERYRRIVRGE